MNRYFRHIQFRNFGEMRATDRSPVRRVIYRFLPAHVWIPLRSEIRFALVRLLAPVQQWRFRRSRSLMVNLGAGDQGRPGWINVDAVRLPGINCLYDCRARLPFPDESVRGIFCEHFFEHLDYTEEVPRFLAECRRVLQPGGMLRLIVPDAERYLRGYCTADWSDLAELRSLDGSCRDPFTPAAYRTRLELVNAVFRQGYQHKFAYDFETLQFVLEHAGFAGAVVRQEFGRSQLGELVIDQPRRAVESLYVEAVKEPRFTTPAGPAETHDREVVHA